MDGVKEWSFGQVNFGAADFGDARRTKRFIKLIDLMCRHPGGTLPAKLAEPRNLRAFYRIMNAPEVTHASIMESHYVVTRDLIETALVEKSVVLIIHDATELDYTNIQSLQDHLGQIGQGTRRGYICHNSLAVRADSREVLGFTSQILHHRADVPEKETKKQCRERESRESRLWVQGATQSRAAPTDGLVVDVSDTLSDTFEYMAYEISENRRFLLRAKENRRLAVPINGHDYLFGAVRSWRSRESYTIDVKGNNGRKARKTTVNLSYGPIVIAPPGKRSGNYEKEPLFLWGIRVWEPITPKGEEPLEWILLTNVAATNGDEARTRASWYEMRPIVEDLHKGMKTGCGIETLQFDKIDRLEPAIATLSILATRLMKLRDAVRKPNADTRPATEVVDPIYVEVVTRHYPKRLTKSPSVKQFYMHVARLGGHQNRKRDGFPGWITLWRGWMKVESMAIGYRLALRKQKKSGIT